MEKGRKKSLSYQQRIEICQKLKKGVRPIQIASEYGICVQTVYKIKHTKMFKLMEEQKVYVKDKGIIYSNVEKQLHDWCVEHTVPGDKIRINWVPLVKKACEIIINTDGPIEFNVAWLWEFIRHHNIEVKHTQKMTSTSYFLKWQLKKHKKVDEQLFNWLLELIISGDKISCDLLKYKTKKLMHEFDELLNKNILKSWLSRFRKCHEILINSVTLENLKKGGDETDQSDKVGQLATHETNLKKQNIEFKQYNYKQCISLEKQLVNWLLERKKSGDTISHTMLRDETLKLIIDEFNGSSKKIEEENWLWKIAQRYFLRPSYTFERFQRKIQESKEIYEREQFDEFKKFFYKLNQRLEEENINKNNIYSMIKTDVLWKSNTQILEILECKETKEEIVKQRVDIAKVKNSVTAMFCINVTGSHKLPPITRELTYDDQTLEGAIVTKESKEFAFWYDNLFKKSVKDHQLKENITGKVLLFVENWTQYILSEKIMQDDDVEILILPINTVSFFQLLYPELSNEIYQMFENDMLKRIEKLTNLCKESLVEEFNRSYDINFYTDTICKSWSLIKTENIEELWRKFLEQGRQTQEDLVLSTAQLVNYIIRVYG